jgi:hypothetical protein
MAPDMDAQEVNFSFGRRKPCHDGRAAGDERRLGERRQGLRMRTLISGQVIYNHGQSTLDCQIRNLSGGGAKITAEGASAVPDSFKLFIPSRGTTYAAEVRWRNVNSVGVKFVVAATPDASPAPLESSEELLQRLEQENGALRLLVVELRSRLLELGFGDDRY